MPQVRNEQINILRAFWTKHTGLSVNSNIFSIPAATFNAWTITGVPNGSVNYLAPVRGILVTNPDNLVKVRDGYTQAPITDSVTKSVVYARLTYSPTTYVLSFYYLNASGVQTAATISTIYIDILIPEVMYSAEVKPNAAIIDGGGFISTTLLSANTQNWNSTLGVSPSSSGISPIITSGDVINFPGTGKNYFIDNNSTNGIRVSGTNAGASGDIVTIESAQTASTASGIVNIQTGNVTAAGSSGVINIQTGLSATDSDGGQINIGTPNVTTGSGRSGNVVIFTGDQAGNAFAGNVTLQGGNQTNVLDAASVGGQIALTGGSKYYGPDIAGGPIMYLYGSSTGGGGVIGGDITIGAGSSSTGSTNISTGGSVNINGGSGKNYGGSINIAAGVANTSLGAGGAIDITAADGYVGGSISISPGNSSGGSKGGGVTIISGLGGEGGDILLETSVASASGTSNGGSILIRTAPGGIGSVGTGGTLTLSTGNGGAAATGIGGAMVVTTGSSSSASGGPLNVITGDGYTGGGTINVTTGNCSTIGNGGFINITTGTGENGGGGVNILTGNCTGSGTGGAIIFTAGTHIPTGNIGASVAICGGTPGAGNSGYVTVTGRYIFVGNSTSVPTYSPVGGGYLYANAGALYWRGAAGTLTLIALA